MGNRQPSALVPQSGGPYGELSSASDPMVGWDSVGKENIRHLPFPSSCISSKAIFINSRAN